MSGNLVIVESPAKAKTIERYLGPGYTVLASYGHVRDLPENPGKNKLGVDVDNDFAPVYEVVADRKKQLAAIQKAAAAALEAVESESAGAHPVSGELALALARLGSARAPAAIEALVARDEEVLRNLLALLVNKGVASRNTAAG